MKLPTRLIFALCFGLMATSSQAAEHEVFITKNGYFPSTLYISEGDTVTFNNISGRSAIVAKNTGSYYYPNWVTLTPWVGNKGKHQMVLNSGTLDKIGSNLPVPILSDGYSSYYAKNGAQLSYASAPLSCPDNRVLC